MFSKWAARWCREIHRVLSMYFVLDLILWQWFKLLCSFSNFTFAALMNEIARENIARKLNVSKLNLHLGRAGHEHRSSYASKWRFREVLNKSIENFHFRFTFFFLFLSLSVFRSLHSCLLLCLLNVIAEMRRVVKRFPFIWHDVSYAIHNA